MLKKAATLIDVAAKAGVSGKTVSRVVKGDPYVSEKTRAKVEAAVAELDFQLNHAARSLRDSRSYFLGVVTSYLPSAYMAELHMGAIQASRAQGFHLAIEEFVPTNQQSIVEFERRLRHVRYDGMILSPPICDDAPTLDMLDRCGIKYIRIAPYTDVERSSAVFADEEVGVEQLARHLWSLGHRRVGLALGPGGFHATHARECAFRKEFERLGGGSDAVCSEPFTQSRSMVAAGRDAAKRLLAQTDRPTAVFAYNDEMAAGVLIWARELGLGVPTDLAIAGFDDNEIAGATWPTLTTVRQPIAQIAREAVNLLINTTEAERLQRVTCPVELIVRGSTDARQEAFIL